MAITGTNFVRFTRHGLQAIRRSWAKIGDRFEVRRQALKLRFWDERHLHVAGMLFDHSYENIKGLPHLGIYELRLDDEIGGESNIRLSFSIRLRIGSRSLAKQTLCASFGSWRRCRNAGTTGQRITSGDSERLGS